MNKIRVAICGYGNLGRAVQRAVRSAPDMELRGIFSRRPERCAPFADGVPALPEEALYRTHEDLDVAILCGSSAYDLPRQTPRCAAYLSFVDSFDVHSRAREHFLAADQSARNAGTTGIVSAGWDPGLFSCVRAAFEAFLPSGKTSTFWGRGISQGHSAALRGVEGVADARQYTVPRPEALRAAADPQADALPPEAMHLRECYVVLKPGADPIQVERSIREMPGYFSGYETHVHFVSQLELDEHHHSMAHAGAVLRSGVTGQKNPQGMKLSLELGSNPEFTAGILTACARAAVRLHNCGHTGCHTMLDVPPALYCLTEGASLQKQVL